MTQKTSDRILDVARGLLTSGGLAAVSFDAIARELGVSKQAVLYWFPSKQDLLAAMFLPWVEAEVSAAVAALETAATPAEAVGAFVRAVARFHLGDLDRFRAMYFLTQTTPRRRGGPAEGEIIKQVPAVTDRLYAALAARLDGTEQARRAEALAIHVAVLGLVLMVGLADALQDPLKQSDDALIEALVARLGGR